LLTDIGTLWTMRRPGRIARCALLAGPYEWEVRVVVDGITRVTRRCGRGGEAFELAGEWKDRMLDEGWHQVVPPIARSIRRRTRRRTKAQGRC
jgi:hypothetical protein